MYVTLNRRIFESIPKNSKILDIGSATGVLGMQIRKKKTPQFLAGIEMDARMSAVGHRFYDQILVADINTLAKLSFRQNFFDVIVLGDVLEHLIDPEKCLVLLKKYLHPGGVIIVSVPNVAFITIRLAMLLGRFNYTDKGILDKTHLHFFTLDTVKRLIARSGYKIISARGYINTRPAFKFLDFFARVYPSLFAYQYLLVAKKVIKHP